MPLDPPVEELIFPPNHRLLELQLMNRWSTVTYKSLCTKVAEDDHVWQVKVPAMSLHYDFLLNGLFALSAFEVASSSENGYARYLRAAVEYQTQALSSFMPQLHDITPNSFEAILCFSMMLMVLALASAQFASDSESGECASMVRSTITHFELLRGCTTVLESKKNYIAESPYIRKLKRFEELPRAALDSRTETALAKLSEVNERRITSSIGESYESRVRHISYWEACKKAILLLRENYEKCVDIDYQGYVLGWLNMAGDDYIKAIKADDRIALLILMYWGVLIEKLGHQAWWARRFGGLLVQEISNRELNEDTDMAAKDIILWAQELIQAR